MNLGDGHREAATRHLLAAEPCLSAVVQSVGPYVLEIEPDGFTALARSIVSQQISTSAARTIWGRLNARVGVMTPGQLVTLSDEDFRLAGLSSQKVKYLRDLAGKTAAGTVDFRRIEEMSDEAVVEHVVQVNGIGVWTAHMFLIFSLGRPDVFPWGDLGVRTALKRLYRLKALPERAKCERLAKPWRPHASAAAWYLWRSLDLPEKG